MPQARVFKYLRVAFMSEEGGLAFTVAQYSKFNDWMWVVIERIRLQIQPQTRASCKEG